MPEETKPSDLVYLKCRFMVEDKTIYGIFIALIDIGRIVYESMNLFSTHYKSIMDETFTLDNWINFDYFELEEFITQSRKSGDLADKETSEIYKSIDHKLQSAELEYICELISKKDVGGLDQKFYEIFIKVFNNPNIELKFAFDKTSYEAIEEREEAKEKIYQEQQSALKQKEDEFIKIKEQAAPLDGAILDISFILAPVSGIPLDTLSIGDDIMVRIETKSSKGKYFAEFLDLIRDDKLLSVPAKVQKIAKSPNGEYFVLCKIQEGIYGKLSETEQVKIKRYDPDKDGPFKGKKLPKLDKNKFSNKQNLSPSEKEAEKSQLQIFILAGALIVLVTLIIVYLSLF